MKPLRVLICLVVALGTASGAWAQYGLSGAPEPLRLGPDARNIQAAPANAVTLVGATDADRTFGAPQGYPSTQSVYYGPPLAPQSSPAPAPQAPSPNVMNQMLDETGCYGAPPSGCGNGCGIGRLCGESCGMCCGPKWYAWAAGLFMGRADKANCLWTTYETNNNPNQLMRTNDAKLNFASGYEFRIGRWLDDCHQWALEVDYWRIDGFNGTAETFRPGGGVSTPLLVDGIEFNGVNGTNYFDGADDHSISRHDIFENIEINLVRAPVYIGGECCPLDVSWLVGFRYFRFDENLVFDTEAGGYPDDARLADHVYNNLFGVQMGWEAGYRLGCAWRAFAGVKVGLYDNHIENNFDAFLTNNVHANPTAGSGVVGSYPVAACKDQFSVLTELDVGLQWKFHPQWNAFVGYRLIAATGIGLADEQFLTYVVDIPEYQRIKSNGDLILHGGFAGLEFRF